MWWMDEGWHGGGGPFWIFPLVWLIIVGTIVTVVIMNRRSAAQRRGVASGHSVLAERYARGEIDEQEYEQRADVLRRKRK